MINAYAALAPQDTLNPYSYEPKPLEPHQIEIAITHCGICHSDIRLIDNDWGISHYPLIPGHEIVGHILNKGKQVTWLQKEQRVGIGWQCGSCMRCDYCMRGEENLCSKLKATCVSQFGGFAQSLIVDARFAFELPAELDSAKSAPLLCAGASVYAPLRRFIQQPSMRVGIIGIGGLGHLALQFARGFGCEVAAFSSSADKKIAALELGASQFISSTDFRELRKYPNTFDLIINTVPRPLEWRLFLKLLKPRGTLCFLGVPNENLNIPVDDLIDERKNICGSNIAGRVEIKEMLAFSAKHRIEAKVETFSLSEVNQAIEKIRKNKIRYRAILSV